ncbi:MAG: PD-(D/E)XK nuclease domain-containing protein [Myxococcota bacterium]
MDGGGEGRRAIEQIKEKRYYERYMNMGREIYIVGIEFSKEERNIVRFDWEKVGD